MASLFNVCAEDSYSVYTGDLTDFVYVRPAILDGAAIDANWSCSQLVLNNRDQIVVSETSVTEKSAGNVEFKCYLTATQTANLSAGTYNWVIQMTNSSLSPPFVKELHFNLYVEDQGIS